MNNHALKSGVILSVISIVITLLIYIIDPMLMIKWWFGLISLALALILVSYFGIQYRNEGDGYINFKQSFIYSWIMFIVAGFIGTLFMMLLYNVIDPDLPGVLSEASKEQTIQMMSNFGAPEDAIDDAIAQAEENGDFTNPFTFMGQVKAFGIVIIIYAVLSLITGAIIRKKEPELV